MSSLFHCTFSDAFLDSSTLSLNYEISPPHVLLFLAWDQSGQSRAGKMNPLTRTVAN